MALHRVHRVDGLTLVEALAALAILALVAAAAVPALSDWQQTTRLRSAANSILSDLRLAQSEARKRGRTLTVRFSVAPDGAWCYGWWLDTSCDCRLANQCVVDGVERVVHGSTWPGITLTPGVSQNTFAFTPRRGTVTAGHVTLTGSDGSAIRVTVHGMGRMRLCQPANSPPVADIPPC